MSALVQGSSTDRSHTGSSFTDALNSAAGSAAARLSGKVDDWTDRLDDIAAGTVKSVATEIGDEAQKGLAELTDDGGAKQSGMLGALTASLRGDNPFWAAVKGFWTGGSAPVKAAIITAVVGAVLMLLVLSPVLLLVFLLSLLIIAAVTKARATRK